MCVRVCVRYQCIYRTINFERARKGETKKERENGKVRQQLKGMETKNHRFDDLIIEETSEEGWLTARRQGAGREGRPHGLQRQLVCSRGVPEWEVGSRRRGNIEEQLPLHRVSVTLNWTQIDCKALHLLRQYMAISLSLSLRPTCTYNLSNSGN